MARKQIDLTTALMIGVVSSVVASLIVIYMDHRGWIPWSNGNSALRST